MEEVASVVAKRVIVRCAGKHGLRLRTFLEGHLRWPSPQPGLRPGLELSTGLPRRPGTRLQGGAAGIMKAIENLLQSAYISEHGGFGLSGTALLSIPSPPF